MRDAFGGVFTMNFLLVFIFIYVAFTAVSLNYAKAYKVKNAVIDFVEQKEIADLSDYFGHGMPVTELDERLTSYHKTCSTNDEVTLPQGTGYCYKGVVILKNREEPVQGTNNTKVVYYTILTYADWNLGALNKLLALAGERPDSVVAGTWAISGEAKVVVRG